MARGQHPTWLEGENGFRPSGGPPNRKRSPSRGFLIGMGAVALFAITLTAVSTIAAQSSGGTRTTDELPVPMESPIPVEITVVPPEVTPDPDYTGALPETRGPAGGSIDIQITPEVAQPQATASTQQAPRTAASSWSAGPTPVPPAPAAEQPAPVPEPAPTPELVPATVAAGLAAEANETYGVNIVLEGMDWGSSEEAEAVNIQAVISAMDRLPDTISSSAVTHSHGALTFVSNNEGRTLDGWQPYGGHPMAYYTNADNGAGGYHASNQVVLSVGAASMSVGHEILHSFQFRNVGPDEYAVALLQPEMRSFMAATGWRQTGDEDQVRAAAQEPWSALDALYVYEGRALTYGTSANTTDTITAANPIEAFAITGSIYYTRPSWMPLPDWPEYWAWFSANIG